METTRPPAPPARPSTSPPVMAMPPAPMPTPPPMKVRTPTAPVAPPAPALDDDILGSKTEVSIMAVEDPYFKSVFDQFLAMKKACGEPTSGLTYAKFAEKLVKNRDDLMAKTSCREVRFTVYAKDGKAALKATPVKDDV